MFIPNRHRKGAGSRRLMARPGGNTHASDSNTKRNGGIEKPSALHARHCPATCCATTFPHLSALRPTPSPVIPAKAGIPFGPNSDICNCARWSLRNQFRLPFPDAFGRPKWQPNCNNINPSAPRAAPVSRIRSRPVGRHPGEGRDPAWPPVGHMQLRAMDSRFATSRTYATAGSDLAHRISVAIGVGFRATGMATEMQQHHPARAACGTIRQPKSTHHSRGEIA